MKTWKKIVLGSVSLLAATALLAACSSNSKETSSSGSDSKTLKLWVPTGAKDSYADTVSQFEKDSGYKVEVVEMEDPNAQENLTKDASTAADVFSLPHDQLGKLVEAGAIQEIPSSMADEIKKNDTEQAALGAQYKGKTYAFPFGIESQVTYYNKSKLTADDVKSYETITSKGKFGGNLKEVNAYAIAPLFLSVGDTLFGADGEQVDGTNWGNEAGVNVLKFIAAQKDNSGFVNVDASNLLAKFGDGSVDAFQSGPWDYAAAEKAVGKDNLG
ncbi:extracellular solute-binding protein, partial [Streptococcus sp. DD11]